MSLQTTISGHYIDIVNKSIFPAIIEIQDGLIYSVSQTEEPVDKGFILPGFIDAHIHIESSMLVPTQFAKVATTYGTVATISDPHEIANVCGLDGVEFMIDNAHKAPLKFYFGAPSCVPATTFETAGATLDASDVAFLLERDEIKYLTEMMNFPGVLNKDPEVMAKIKCAQDNNKPIDGHAPGLRGELAAAYASVGISTDHECFTIEEALDKIHAGMKILIREGSAAKNFDALVPLFKQYPQSLMFCSDDKHPDELLKGHINQLVARAVAYGADIFDVLYAACIAPVEHYDLEVGTLNVADAADFIIVEDLIDFKVTKTYIDGKLVAQNGKYLLSVEEETNIINQFNITSINKNELVVKSINPTDVQSKVAVIEALDGQLITNKIVATLPVENGEIQTDIDQDIIKIAVVNRYNEAPIKVGFIKNFGLQDGAIASTVAHDSHNIVVVGVDDKSIALAIERLIKSKGGIALVNENRDAFVLNLPIAGLMSTHDAKEVATAYTELTNRAKKLGSKLHAPFMTLSFMALPVIPSLKMTDKGLFDVEQFDFTNVIL